MRRLLLALILAGSLLVPVTAARANGTTVSASGSFSVVPSIQSAQIINGQLFFVSNNTITFTGTLSGTSLCRTSGVVNLATGLGTFRCNGTFSGTVAGVSGAYLIGFSGTITAPSAVGTGTITSDPNSQGDQEDLVGRVSIVQNLDCVHPEGCLAGTYTGQITLDS